MSASKGFCYPMCSVCGWNSQGESPVVYDRLPLVCPQCGLPATYEVCPDRSEASATTAAQAST